MDTKNILGKNPPKALRVLVAELLLQPMVALERATASWSDLIPKEPLENVSVVPPTENPLASLLACLPSVGGVAGARTSLSSYREDAGEGAYLH